MIKAHEPSYKGLLIAKLVATTIICALMYKGIGCFVHYDTGVQNQQHMWMMHR